MLLNLSIIPLKNFHNFADILPELQLPGMHSLIGNRSIVTTCYHSTLLINVPTRF